MSRHRTAQLLGSAVAVVALGLSGCGTDGSDGEATPDGASSAAESPAEASTSPTTTSPATTDLVLPDSASSTRCMVPTAEALATQTTAFEGTVSSLEDGVATLEVDRWYAGEETEQVTLTAPDEELSPLVAAVELEVGRTYLVSATGDQVSLCGFTAEKSAELEALYAEAFAP